MSASVWFFMILFSIPVFYLAYLQVCRPEEYRKHRERHDKDVKTVFGTAVKVGTPIVGMLLKKR